MNFRRVRLHPVHQLPEVLQTAFQCSKWPRSPLPPRRSVSVCACAALLSPSLSCLLYTSDAADDM
eukprot:5604191-Prymnesium_polylepis.1